MLAHALTGAYPSNLLGNPAVFSHLYVWTSVWQEFGRGSIVYLAALSNVDPQLHEEAVIDSPSRRQRIWTADLPCILPTATIMLILRTGSVMSVGFEKIYLLQNSLNLGASEIISTYVYKVGMGVGNSSGASHTIPNYSYSTAINLLILSFILF